MMSNPSARPRARRNRRARVDAGTPVVLLKVRGEKIAPSAPNGGLCDAAPTTFLAYASVAGELRLAAFKGATVGAGARAEDLCGTYNYMR